MTDPYRLEPAVRTEHRRRGQARMRNRILVGLAILAAFAVGVALGQALSDNPRPGGVQTGIKTFRVTNPPRTP